MDLHLIPNVAATTEEKKAVAAAIDAPLTRPDDGRGKRHLLLPALRSVQSQTGWISQGALNEICHRLEIPPAEAYGVASFYALFSMEKRPPRVVHVCDDVACRIKGAREICASLEETLGPAGRPDANAETMWVTSPCLGQCEKAPAVLLQQAGTGDAEVVRTSVTPDQIPALLTNVVPMPVRNVPPQKTEDATADLRLLSRIGKADPENLDSYKKHGGYAALERAFEMGPQGIINEVTASGLMGRGGAAFPTGVKWKGVAAAKVRPHYLVCNADESEPGTFKDRILMEEDPFAIIEAMTIAAFATGCERGFIYIRGEYPDAAGRLENAISTAREAGYLGPDIGGRGFSFEVEVRRGAGAYICGEETALFNSLEGFRGEPRSKPPFPTEVGLFGKPTLVNNVETLANIPRIVLEGGSAFASIGTQKSTGTRLFCLSGCVTRPGLYEVPFGTTLSSLIELSGGVAGGRKMQAILLGGAAGTFVTPDELDMKLTFEDVRAAGATLGSGVAVVFDDTIDMEDILLRIAAFFRDESCGQCVPCRVGTVRQEEGLHRLHNADGRGKTDRALLSDVGQVMRDASICGLGQTAASAVLSALEKLAPFNGKGDRA